MRIRIRCRDNDHKHCNWLKWQSVSRMFQENRWRAIPTVIVRSGSYADPPNHCYATDLQGPLNMAVKRKPQTSPGPAVTQSLPSDDFTLPAALYYDAIHHYEAAESSKMRADTCACDRFMRSSLLAAFSFFEAQLNQVAFAYAHTHRRALGQIELDVLEEMETSMDERGNIVRKTKFYKTEVRFLFLVYFLSGKEFECNGSLWQQFQAARKLRDHWTHPKPPFDTWALTLPDVRAAIRAVHDLFVKLAEMMNSNHPLWMKPIDDVLEAMRGETK